MKKLLVIFTAIVLMATLAACGANNTEQSSEGGDSTYLYGKITQITGNEIELAIALMPDDDTAGGDEGSKDAIDIPDDAAAALMPATEASLGDTFEESMEYTGETLTLTLPAGVEFLRMGEESTISELKKGSLVSITVDNMEDMNISSVSIMS